MANANNWQGQMLTALAALLDAQEATTVAVEGIPTGGSASASSSWKLGTCEQCEHWSVITPAVIGECRRFPPVEASYTSLGESQSRPPETLAAQSCSEWTAVVVA